MDTYDFSYMTEIEFAAYVAGFTDGEGYVGIEPTDRKNISIVRIVLANCVPEVLRGIQQRLGYGSIRSQHQRPNWRERFTLSFTNMNDCKNFLILIRPYLHIKAEPADKALNRIEQAGNNIRDKMLAIEARNTEIRRLAGTGMMRKQIAEQFGVSPQLISNVCNGHKWPSERSRVAKQRKRDKHGLFVPVR